MTDEWDFWRDCLAGRVPREALQESKPMTGFWRMRRSGGSLPLPVAIWRMAAGGSDTLVLWCKIGEGKIQGEAKAIEVWPWCAEPITEEVYRAVAERGESWPDIDATVAEQVRPGRNHNQPPEDPAELLKEQIEAARQGVSAYDKIEDDETAKRAQSLRSRLLELSREADKAREKEKRPHFDAAKATDAKWMPLVNLAKGAADTIRQAMDAWETAKLQRERAEAAERAKQEQEARDRDVTLAEAGVQGPGFAPPPEPAPVASAPVKGAYGRAASVKAVKVVTEVTDWPALFAYFQPRAEVQDILKRLAQRAVEAGHDVPGVKVEEQRKVA